MLTALCLDHAEEARRKRAPLCNRFAQAALAGRGEGIVLTSALLAGGPPFAVQQSLTLQLVQCRIERTLLAIKIAVTAALYLACKLIPVQWAVPQDGQHDHSHRAILEICSCRHYSTILCKDYLGIFTI